METNDKIKLYVSLFRGRDDVFAKRSPTTGSYFPDYTLNWDEFNAHKANGGRMATFKNKKLIPLTDQVILKHLAGLYQVLLATGQIFGEGMHIESIEAMILAFPFAFDGKTEQYAGRLNHALKPQILIDYHDKQIPFLDRQFKSRKKTYKRMGLEPESLQS